MITFFHYEKNRPQKSRKTKDDEVELEDRFAAAETRPQFRSVKKDQNKVVLDERFASVLTDSRFQLEGKDKYGRKKKKLFLDLENKTKEICKACIILYVFWFASYSLMVRQESSRDIPRKCWPCEIAIHA